MAYIHGAAGAGRYRAVTAVPIRTAVVRTAVILAAGQGSRMRRDEPSAALDASQAAVAASGIKGMMPYGKPLARPFLEYVISALADAGITEVVLVIGSSHDLIRTHFTTGVRSARVQLRFVVQPEPLGTANAVAIAADSVGSEPFLVLNSDNYYPVEAFRLLAEYGDAATVAFDRAALLRWGNIPAERVRAFAALDVDADGTLRGVVEKPGGEWAADDPRFRWVGMNLWCITPDLADACRRVPRSTRGEFELPEAVALAIREGVTVRAMPFEGGVLDLSHRSGVSAVQQALADITPRL
jgi:UDP-N-acetylglucosamine diphosphorylase / glucose-1-phosphate thymidylyltransferase / UDP-N-acetylgalactosamine diphosphorylase / glucosamine-1-phosphate N-acetyltransferase / galactosamine-1-phosphate N-acetyltransferase